MTYKNALIPSLQLYTINGLESHRLISIANLNKERLKLDLLTSQFQNLYFSLPLRQQIT